MLKEIPQNVSCSHNMIYVCGNRKYLLNVINILKKIGIKENIINFDRQIFDETLHDPKKEVVLTINFSHNISVYSLEARHMWFTSLSLETVKACANSLLNKIFKNDTFCEKEILKFINEIDVNGKKIIHTL